MTGEQHFIVSVKHKESWWSEAFWRGAELEKDTYRACWLALADEQQPFFSLFLRFTVLFLSLSGQLYPLCLPSSQLRVQPSNSPAKIPSVSTPTIYLTFSFAPLQPAQAPCYRPRGSEQHALPRPGREAVGHAEFIFCLYAWNKILLAVAPVWASTSIYHFG